MKRALRIAILAFAAAVSGVLALGGATARRAAPADREDPRAHLTPRREPVDHAGFFREAFPDGPSVTRACLRCHEEAAREFMKTSHWTWASQIARDPETGETLRVGKKNLINNFCLAVAGNWPRCTSCHAGYGWKDASFDFSREDNVDCLVCHDRSGAYFKDPAGAGLPAPGADLLAAARSVGRPARANCGSCHFNGGGGDAVKHGDMDGSMMHPSARIDVHMGKLDFSCTECHRTEHHDIPGAAMSIGMEGRRRVSCTDCHSPNPHGDERLDAHTSTVACETCHVPLMALDARTKVRWDWSDAGKSPVELRRDRPDLFAAFRSGWTPPSPLPEPGELARIETEAFAAYLQREGLYSKEKGTFAFAKRAVPEYAWYDGRSERYLTGQEIDPTRPVAIARPLGDVRNPSAKIHPFKVHRGRQPYDAKRRTLVPVKTYGPGGFWTEYDWEKAIRLGTEAAGVPYSGQYDFVETEMWWPLSHMVEPKEHSLRCGDCHAGPGASGRLPWSKLGYDADPAFEGTRFVTRIPASCEREERP